MSRRRTAALVALVAVAGPLTACGAPAGVGAVSAPVALVGLSEVSALTQVSLTSTSPAVEPPSRAILTTNPSGGNTSVLPGAPVSVRAIDGRLTAVRVTSPEGATLAGELSQDGTSWVSTDKARGYGSRYVVAVTAVDREGRTTSTTKEFSTLVPDETVTVSGVTPEAGSSFGVGMPLTVSFDQDIVNKAAVEKRLVVSTPTPIVGAWRWISDTTAEYRPEKYWPGNIPITVRADLTGVEVAPGVWGEKSATYQFRTTDAIVGKVDMDEYTLTVRRNGKVIRTIPITTGKSGFETRSGIKVVMTKERNRIMDAATGGTDTSSPEYYRLNVEYAMRLTWSGEFLHAAPWSTGSQGYANVSHGCTGMSTDNAAWLYDISNIGDVYEYVGNDRMLDDNDNGITVWNTTWSDWLADSEAGAQTTSVS